LGTAGHEQLGAIILVEDTHRARARVHLEHQAILMAGLRGPRYVRCREKMVKRVSSITRGQATQTK
jgi:hypothetical protein